KDFQVLFKLKEIHKKIAKDIDSRKYDIVLVHTDNYTQAPFILKFLKTKSVYFCLEPLRMAYEYSLKVPKILGLLNKLYESINRMIRKRIDQDNARKATYTMAISLFGREYMIHAFNLYPKISYLGVDHNLFLPHKLDKKNQVLFVAEKESIYGYDFAKAAIDLIPKNVRPDLKIIFGTKKEQRISDKELIKTYNESLVTLSLSKFDTFGLVPLESMACATPVIAFNVAGYRETVIDGKTGYLVDFDAKEIAEKIMFFIKNPLFSIKMGKEGREWIEEKWTWKLQVKKLEELLREFSSK
ncbi:glycosyltransferase family 4 protein, partial [Candidatus Roizmanbacteria bacterium]|nr:glycosyltransferase family 4 protein [Candidatus Roizmanbacteria bacterium]